MNVDREIEMSAPAPSPAPIQVVEDVGIVAVKYGIMALFGPVVIMVVVYLLRFKLCRCLSYQSVGQEAEATRVDLSTTIELAELSPRRPVTQVKTMISEDSDDDSDQGCSIASRLSANTQIEHNGGKLRAVVQGQTSNVDADTAARRKLPV